ncbi:single-stranded DNA-binding protein [Micromonospora sp. ATA32]|nr:single-stranded DNA-binding protein [Micromonospora sp. ATA32]
MSLPTMNGVGRLTGDAELRFAPSGTPVAKIPLAFNQRKKDESGNWVDGDVFFVTGTLFKQAAENAAETYTKGMEVVVSGRLKTRQWEDNDGQKRSMPELLIDAIGPSTSFATAKVEKNARDNNGGGARTAAPDDPWAAAAAPAGARSGGRSSNFDEEPPF